MEYRLEQIDEKTWLIEEFDSSGGVYMYLLIGAKKAALIDTGLGTIPLYSICRKLTDLPIMVILTHGHVDHIGGTDQFEEVYLQEADWKTYQLHGSEFADKYINSVRPRIKETVSLMGGEKLFDLGGRILRIIHAPGHSLGSICILDQERRWLFTGDTCCKGHVLLQLEYSASLDTYAQTMEKLWGMRTEYDLTWPGHHVKPVTAEIPEQFLAAARGIISKEIQGSQVEIRGETVNLLLYKDIGIVYPYIPVQNMPIQKET